MNEETKKILGALHNVYLDSLWYKWDTAKESGETKKAQCFEDLMKLIENIKQIKDI